LLTRYLKRERAGGGAGREDSINDSY